MTEPALPPIPAFEHRYDAPDVSFGAGALAEIPALLDRRTAEGALVICGETVGANGALMAQVTDALGDDHAGVFAGSTTSSDVDSVRAGVDLLFEAIEQFRTSGADAIVGVGGGASLDFARAVRLLAPAERTREAVVEAVEGDGRIPGPPEDRPLPVMVAVPTTFAGADCSIAGGLKFKSLAFGPAAAAEQAGDPSADDVRPTAYYVDRRLMPTAVVFDADAAATTPYSVLAASAMNGFNKGIESLYSRHANPIASATASRGLAHFRRGLPALEPDGAGAGPRPALDHSLAGALLVQYGLAAVGTTLLSILHAFGHGLSQRSPVHQGRGHAMVTPAVLEFVFERVDANRRAIAEALGLDVEGRDDAAVAAAVVGTVRELRDALDVPRRLRDAPGLERADLPAVARATVADPFVENGPPGLELRVEDAEAVLREAW